MRNEMKIVEGDLIQMALNGEFDVIVHGSNCYCAMGAGIAKTIKQNFPEAYKADCKTQKGSSKKLGTISYATVLKNDIEITVVNGYTQHHWKGNGVLVDYDAVRGVMRAVKENFSGKRIGYPLIGAGLARGNWEVIKKIIEEELEGENHTLVKFNGKVK